MKILGFYISRTDWKGAFDNMHTYAKDLLKEFDNMHTCAKHLLKELEKHERQRDDKGRFVSKQKQLHDQMRNYYNKPTDYAAVKKASKI
jgi:hypothetical protein